ncbi:prolyl oligopeptidase family serine peptidase [Phialemonium atrogriseum]|uniref:Prolyl oligopeptidase family serine peptidase n=1 Tax=Phialemonium atrogriseum TaxID=1093897 RepID=A0AAJ0FGY8_9PEZI|nr:prolyl oligopeptidase family serine peptidase [Phialemonium atrogriseum]KAK1762838.1 prolyl oligopeptidase family serine peptidase [Phialemonium atrogriseum]
MATSDFRQQVLAKLGRFPKRVALDVVLETTTDCEDHTRTLAIYAVEDGERISAWLLTPKGASPQDGWPVILAIHQHAGQFHLGKSEPAGTLGDSTFHYGLELCRRGYVVLCPDLLCFEDRRPTEDVRHRNQGALDGIQYEQFEFTKRILRGSCLQTKYLHDLSCSLDVLASLPNTDAARVGVIGHSLGGQEALWLTWYDSRVRVAVSSCGFGLLDTIVRDGINHNRAAYIPGLLETCDLDALLCEIAPRAFLLTAGETDWLFPIDGVRSIARRAEDVYAQEGVPDHFKAVVYPGGHSFPEAVKAEAYNFLDHHLKGM